MGIWRALGMVLALLAGVPAVKAQQTYTLSETGKAGDCFRIQIDMNLSGEMRISKNGQPLALKLTAVAGHDYHERIFSVGSSGLPDKSARFYETARASISVEGNKTQRTLRTDRMLVVAQRHKDQPLVYSPAGPLTREEVELIGEHFDSLTVAGLLPGKAVVIGDTWKVPSSVVQALCHFEGLTEQDLACKLEKVENKLAHVSVTGSATGIDLGALAKVKIQAAYQFDTEARRLVRLEWKQQDEREQGPASPTSAVQAATVFQRTPVEQPRELSDVSLVSVPDGFQPPDPLVSLEYRELKNRYDLAYGREWHLVGQTEEHVVMRLLDRGDFLAQMTVTPWTKAEEGKHLSPEAFKEAMANTPGWEMESELQAGTVPTDNGRWIYRLSATGQLEGVPVLQNFYLVAAPTGEQVVLVFTMSPKQAERLGTRDLSIAGSLEFPSSRKDKDKPK